MNRSDLVFNVVGVVVLCLLVFGYGATVSRGPAVIEEVTTVVTTYTQTDSHLQEPLLSVVTWLALALFGFCVIGLVVLVGKGVWRGWKWWVHRASPTVDRIVTIQLHVTNDKDSSEECLGRFRRKAHLRLQRKSGKATRFLSWLIGHRPREVHLMSISETLDSS